jgi:glycosyltransferase involved in cell wall biosynthesis
MKICFLAGANSIHSYKWVKYFADNGHKVSWISFAENTQGKINGVDFYQISKPFPFNFFELKKLVKRIKPDIFHAHYAGVNGFLASLVNFHPFVLTAWGSDVLFAGKSKIKGPFVKHALKKADLITSDAEHIKKAIGVLGIKTAEIKIICFGVDVMKFSPGDKKQEIVDKLKISNCPAVISLRNLEPLYNIESLIKAVPLVLKEFSEVKFIVAGRGPEEENLKKMAETLGVSESIRFVNWIPQNELPEYLRVSDVYVSTSLSDAGLASSTAEAMACELPCIVTDFGDNKEWIKNNESGFLMPLKDFNFLAEKIIYLLKNPEERKRLGANARKVIEEKNNYYKEMEKMEKLYASLKNN